MRGAGKAVVLLGVLAAGWAMNGCKALERIDRLEIEEISLRSVKDGEYQSSQNYFPVTAVVRVTVRAGRISAIQMLKHGHGPGHGAEEILGRVLDKQSLAVDAVSGASYSSKVVLKAIEAALKQGL